MSFCESLFSPRDAYGAEYALLLLTFLLGLTPFRVRGSIGNRRRLTLCRLGYISSLVHIVFFMYCFTYAFVKQESIVGFFFKSEISKIGDTLQKFIGMAGMLILFGISLDQCSDAIKLYEAVASIDMRFFNLGVSFNYGHIMKWTFSKIVLVITVNAAYFGSSLWLLFRNDIWPSFQAIVTFFMPHLFLLTVVVFFSAFIMRFHQYLSILNKLCICSSGIMSSLPKTLVHPKPIEDVYHSFRLYFNVARVFGLIPLHLDRCTTNRPHLRPSLLGHLHMLGRLLLYIVNFYYSLIIEETSVVSHFFASDISRITESTQKINGMLGVSVVLLVCHMRHRQLAKIFTIFYEMENHFANVGVVFHHRNAAHLNNFIILLLVISNAVFIGLSCFGVQYRIGVQVTLSYFITYYCSHCIICGIAVLYTIIARKFAEYLRVLHKVLKNLSHQCDARIIKNLTHKQRSLQCLDSFSLHTIVTKNPSDIIQESMEIHQLICDAASTANKYFTYQLLTIISIAFLIIVFDAYYVLETLLGKSKRESKFKTAEFVTFFSCQMILYLIAIVSIVEGSNRAIKKSEKTSSIVHALLNKAQTLEVKEKLQQFSMQLLHLKINFTAAGLFNIDRTLYFTISGALTTYLIILLQFTSNNAGATPVDLVHFANDNKTIH